MNGVLSTFPRSKCFCLRKKGVKGPHKFCPILDIQEPFTDFHRNEAKKKFFLKKKIQNGRLKKTEFFSYP